jgi:hypothetical protein
MTALICDRDGTPTQLTCASCGSPICPECLVRTEVGLRCPDCAPGASSGGRRGKRRRWVLVGAVGAVGIAIVAVVLIRASSSERPGTMAARARAVTYRTVSRPDLGYAVDVPTDWVPATDNSPTTLSYADPRPDLASLRVTAGQDDRPLADHVDGLVAALREQGGQDFAQTPAQIGGIVGIRLDYRFPTGATPGSTLASHSSFIAMRDRSVVSFQLATTDPISLRPVLDHITSTMRIL